MSAMGPGATVLRVGVLDSLIQRKTPILNTVAGLLKK